jgi:sugar-phosphatase
MTIHLAALFDMDGVLIDTRGEVEQIWSGLVRATGRTLSEAEILRDVHGVPIETTLDRLFPGLSDHDRAVFVRDVVSLEARAEYRTVPGVETILQALRMAGVPTALVTSGVRSKVDRVLPFLGLEGAFDAIVTADVVARGKPDPEPYRLAAAHLGVEPGRCVVFEDSLSGLVSGRAAGAFCVGIGAAAAELRGAGAGLVVEDFTAFTITHGDVLRLRAAEGEVRFAVS